MKRNIIFALASLLSAVFLLDVISVITIQVASRYKLDNFFDYADTHGFHYILEILAGTYFIAYYKLPTMAGMLLLAAAGVSVIMLWLQQNKGKVQTLLAVVYTLAIVVNVVYVAWWYLTGQKWDYI